MRSTSRLEASSLPCGNLPAAAPPWVAQRNEGVSCLKSAKPAHIAKTLRELGVRPTGVVRIDSSVDPETWAADPAANTERIASTFREACDIAADYGETLAAEGEICWGGMHGWKTMINTLEAVDRPNIGFQADMAHTLLYLLGYNIPEERICPTISTGRTGKL